MINTPLSLYIPSENLPVFFQALVNNIVFTNEIFSSKIHGWTLNLTLKLTNGSPINNLTIPSADAPIAISFTNLSSLTIVKQNEDYALRYNPSQVSVLLPTFLKNARIENGQLVQENNSRASINIELLDKYVEFNTYNGINFLTPDLTSFNPTLSTQFLIGDTGIGIELVDVQFNVSSDGLDLSIKKGKVYFPESLGSIPDVEINHGLINKNGFTGELKFDWDLTYDANLKSYKMGEAEVKLFGEFTGGLDFFAVTF